MDTAMNTYCQVYGRMLENIVLLIGFSSVKSENGENTNHNWSVDGFLYNIGDLFNC